MSKIRRIWSKTRRFLMQLRGALPSELPRGVADFDAFADSIFEIYGLPNLPGYRRAIATMVMHLGPEKTHLSKRKIVQAIHKSMANQVAYEVIHRINAEEKMKAESAAAAVATSEGAADVRPISV